MQKFFATCPKGLESLLFNEIQGLNASQVKETVAGVAFSGTMETAMRVCLHSRFASRVLLQLSTFRCEDDSDLYLGAKGVAYERYFESAKTIAVSFKGQNKHIRNTQYGALRVKDAICDRFIESGLARPDVDKQNPDIHVIATVKKGEATISLDLSGDVLFFREANRRTGAAPLKENLAAAMIARAGFDGTTNFVDPMCGSGTLLIEAVSLATDTAPGLMRENFGFMQLRDWNHIANEVNSKLTANLHQDLPEGETLESTFERMVDEAQNRSIEGIKRIKEQNIGFFGFDADEEVLENARGNIARAGFTDLITLECCELDNLQNPCTKVNNLPTTVVTNPPYGERMGNFNELILLYSKLGNKLKDLFKGGRAAVISTSTELLSCLRLSADKIYRLYNGALLCQLRVFKLGEEAFLKEGETDKSADAASFDAAAAAGSADAAGATSGEAANASGAAGNANGISDASGVVAKDFANRLTKNLKKLKKWAERENIAAYRVYDADIQEYNAAIDRYNHYYVLQEYQAPSSISPRVAQQRLLDMIAACVYVFESNGSDLIIKSRERQKGDSQYVKRDDATGHFMEVVEHGVNFKVNLHDYLDTGLFLDARPIRRLIRSLAEGKTFLNLFSYTSTASVVAALGGAKSTTSVDMSRSYLDWGMDNFRINSIDLKNHNFVQADCLAYLSADQGKRYDLIYIDPPTFSNSKRMEKSFDVQRDHALMLGNLTRHLNDGGTVIFCTNRRNFQLDESISEYGFSIEDISSKTFDPDFARDAKMHRCYKFVYTKTNQQKEPEALVENTMRPRWSKELKTYDDRFGGRPDYAESDDDSSVYGRSRDERRDDRRDDRFGRDERRGGRDGERSERRFDRGEGRFGRDDRRGGRDGGRDGERSERRFDRSEGRFGRDDRRGGRDGGRDGERSARRFERGEGRFGREDRRFDKKPAEPRVQRVFGPQGERKDLAREVSAQSGDRNERTRGSARRSMVWTPDED